MRLIVPLGLLALIATGCDARGKAIPYSLRATSASEPRLPNEDFFVGNAKTALPPILAACGVNGFRAPDGEAGEVAFGFDIPASQEKEIAACIEGRAPKGVYLHPAYTL